jgi:hypothetical protein
MYEKHTNRALSDKPKLRINAPTFHTICRFMQAKGMPEGFADGLDAYIKHIQASEALPRIQQQQEEALDGKHSKAAAAH